MPCNGDSTSRLSQAYDDLRRAAEVINDLTSMLCEVCSGGATNLPPRVQSWWLAHQRHDAERKEMEKRRDEEQRRRDLAEAKRLADKWK